MIRIHSGPAAVFDATVASREDPLVRLLDAAYAQVEHRERPDREGLLVAGDGSRIGQERVFERAAALRASLPPRLIPYRLSNGPASWLAIEHGYTGRVLTFPDGPGSIVRALHYLVTSVESGLSPSEWTVLAGRIDHFDGSAAHGVGVALVVGPDGERGAVELASDPAEAPSDPLDAVAALSRASGRREAVLTTRAGRERQSWSVRLRLFGP